MKKLIAKLIAFYNSLFIEYPEIGFTFSEFKLVQHIQEMNRMKAFFYIIGLAALITGIVLVFTKVYGWAFIVLGLAYLIWAYKMNAKSLL